MLKIFSTSPPHLSAFYFALYLHRSLHRSFVCCQICWCFHFWFLGFVPCRGRLGRKVMTNLDSIFKNRDITLPTKVCLVKAMVFPVFMYGCESWTVKKAERRRIGAFELWCWRRLLRVLWEKKPLTV